MTDASPTFVKPSLANALPFWSALLLVPLAIVGPAWGGLWVLLLPFVAWHLTVVIDVIIGSDSETLDPDTSRDKLFWHRAATLIWPFLQTAVVIGSLAYAPGAAHLSYLELVFIFVGVGALSGAVGIVFAHELMHQPSRTERWMGDVLMTQVLYGHFRSEHLLVHHRYVGTPRDPVTARFGEGFHHYFFRVVPACFRSALRAEAAMLARKDLPAWHRSNPFWRYGLLQVFWVGLAFGLAGWLGVALFLLQAFVAIWQLELINYIEHYGLTRKHLGEGRYEPTRPHHSWNDSHSVTRRFLINLTRHSDHHSKPTRPYPLLQNYRESEAPQMPYGYSAMTAMALVPSLWHRVMGPRVLRWRQRFYPEINDWSAYDTLTTPMPR